MKSLPAAYARLSAGDLSSCEQPWCDFEDDDAKTFWQAAIAAEAMVQRGTFDVESDAGRRALFLNTDTPPPGAALAFARLGESMMRSDTLRMATRSWTTLAKQLTRAAPIDARAACVAQVAQAWCWWGDSRESVSDLNTALKCARDLGLSGMIVEIEALRALISLAKEDTQAAVLLARRASRMARTEEIPHLEILTNLVLARVRRLQDHTHLAIHILRGLQPHTPPAWREWLNWELCMAGSPPRKPMIEGPASRFAGLLNAVVEGDALRVRPVTEESQPSAFQDDAALALSLLVPEMLHPRNAPAGLQGLQRWRCGDTHRLPAGLSGLAFMTKASDSAQAQCAFVYVRAERSERIAAASLHFIAQRDGVRLRDEHAKIKQRADSGVALLALAGESMTRAEYFRRLYGFEYEQGPHGAMFGMHRKRMRARLGDAGTLEFDRDGLKLTMHDNALLPDPRAGEELFDRALRAVSSTDGMSARDLARTLNVPLRSAQRALAELIGEGALHSRGEGPQVRYEIEDTTFSEPTQSRLFPSALLKAES